MSRMSLEAESSSRSAWNAQAAVVRCSEAKVLRTPSHVKASRTAAIVVRRRLAGLRSSWFVGSLAGGVEVRRDVLWPVSWDVVVAVDISTCDLLEGWMEGPAAKTACRLVAARAWKSPWLVTILEAYGGRPATEATMEPPDTKSRNQRAKIPDGRRLTERRGLRWGQVTGARGVPHR